MTHGEGNELKVDRLPDCVCVECGKVIVSGAYVWHGRTLCAKCGEFYSCWPEKLNKEAVE